MNKFFLIFFILFFSPSYSPIKATNNEIYGKAKVIDGDTIKINNEKIRLLGIDAFEIKQTCQRSNGSEYDCGKISKNALIEIISGLPVKCITKKKDHYKRWLAVCYVGKLDIGENMVIYGHAVTYKKNKKYKEVEKEAKNIKSGAWEGKFILPWDWRKQKR